LNGWKRQKNKQTQKQTKNKTKKLKRGEKKKKIQTKPAGAFHAPLKKSFTTVKHFK